MLAKTLHQCWMNLRRNAISTYISIVAVSISFTACLLALAYATHELSFERRWEGSNKIFILRNEYIGGPADGITSDYFAYPVVEKIRKGFESYLSGISARAFRGQKVHLEHSTIQHAVTLVEPEFTDIFSFQQIYGNMADIFLHPTNIALRRDTAIQFFGDTNVVGKTLRTEVPNIGESAYTVVAVYDEPTGASNYDFPSLAHLDVNSLPEFSAIAESWQMRIPISVFLRFSTVPTVQSTSEILERIIDTEIVQPGINVSPDKSLADYLGYKLISIRNVHFEPATGRIGASRVEVYAFASIGVICLIVGCLTYTINAGVGLLRRRNEFAIRRFIGARKVHILLQVLLESSIYLSIVILISVLTAVIVGPLVSKYFSISISAVLSSIQFWLLVGVVLCIATIVVVAYLYATAIRASSSITPNSRTLNAGNSKLVLKSAFAFISFLQFSIALALATSAVLVYLQLSYLKKEDYGFSSERVLQVGIPPPLHGERIDVLRGELEKVREVQLTAISTRESNSLSGINTSDNFNLIDFQTGAAGMEAKLSVVWVSDAFFDIYGMQGDRTTLNSDSWKEPFNPSEPGTISSAVINESAARRLSNDSRQQISDSTIRNAKQQEYRVVAVYKDNAFLNLRASAEPTVFLPASNKSAYFLHIKFDESASPELLEREVNEIWRSVFPDAPISYSFVQKRIAREFEPEERYIAYLLLVTIIASALGCLGVFGIISDYRRLAIKGLMIRKLLGAQTWRLYMIPFKELFPPLLAAGLAVSLLIQTYFYPWLELYVARISKITVIAGSAFVYILYSILLAAMIVAVMSKELNESPARKLTT